MRVFKELKSLQPKLNTASIMLDLEKAIHNACNIIFPETTLVGCSFHLGQNLWHKAQEFYFATAYRNDEDLRMRVKMILVLVCPININNPKKFFISFVFQSMIQRHYTTNRNQTK